MIQELRETDVLIASEYFEHIVKPVEHLTEVVAQAKPKFFVIANAFGTKAIGHFVNYEHKGKVIPGDAMAKLSNDTMRGYGYTKLKTKIWNNRPAIWVRS